MADITASLPTFGKTTKTGTAEATAASVITTNTPTNTLLIVTAGANNGAMVTRLSAMPRATTATAGTLYYFISNDSGSTKLLGDSELMAAHTVTTTTKIPVTKFTNITQTNPLRLAPGDRLYVSAAVALAAGIVFTAEYTDFGE